MAILFTFNVNYNKNMKKILLIIVSIIFFAAYAKAQVNTEQMIDASETNKNIKINRRLHFTDLNGKKFTGIWNWQGNDKTFTIRLEKYEHNFGSADKPSIIDLLKGGYIYSVNGKVLADTYSSSPITGSTQGKPNTLYISIFNPDTQKNTDFELTYLGNGRIRWELSKRVREFTRNTNDLGLPENMVLEKKK